MSEKEYESTLPYGDRSDQIEPLLTDQWYVDAKTLAKPAIDAVKSEKYNLYLLIGKKLIFNGWIIFKTGASADNYGGDIEFQFGTMNLIKPHAGFSEKDVREKHGLKGELRQEEDVLHGFHRVFGHLQQWDGLKKMKN